MVKHFIPLLTTARTLCMISLDIRAEILSVGLSGEEKNKISRDGNNLIFELNR